MALERAPELGGMRERLQGPSSREQKVGAGSGEPDEPLPRSLTKTLEGITTPRGEVDLVATLGPTTGNGH